MKRVLAQALCWVLAYCTLSATVAQAQPSELASPTAQPAVPTAAEVALAELHRMQLREPELWKEHEKYCVPCGAAAMAVGVPVALSMLTFGGLILADEHEPDDPGWERPISVALVVLGAAGAVAALWGLYKIGSERRPRNAALNELRSIAKRRTVLERRLDTYVVQPQPAP